MPFDENKRFKVLVVDDDLLTNMLICTELEKANYIVSVAIDGRKAIELLNNDSGYDLILLDVDMPFMNGYETCIAIRANEKLKEIPVIFLTGFSENKIIIEGFKCGAQDFIVKPYNPVELLLRVNTHLQLKHKTDLVKNMNQILEQKVKERTQDLKEANEKLAILEKTKNDFLALISHEMRTPLTGIIGFTEMLKSKITDPEQKEFAEYIVQSAKRLNRFSEIALLITRLKLQEHDFNHKIFDIYELINSCISTLQERVKEKAIKIITKIDINKHSIAMEESLIKFSLMAIIENAIMYSPDTEEIFIRVSSENDYLKLSVRDKGPGFSDEAISQVFNLFTIVNTWHPGEGLGLSLATIKIITNLHKGKVEVKNREQGAEVTLYIPHC